MRTDRHPFFSFLLPVFLTLFVECHASTHCSFKRNATCDSTGNATLNTAEFYKKYNDCYWSLRDKDDIKIDKVNPSLNLAVQCTRPEILVKVHCITPKDVFLTCYMIVNQTNTKNPEWISDGEPHHRNWVFVFIPVSLSLVVISALAVMYSKYTILVFLSKWVYTSQNKLLLEAIRKHVVSEGI
ncbi:uncharacterized protein Hap1MRO34_006055 isoform 1-T1 [Clarias gariepinus]